MRGGSVSCGVVSSVPQRRSWRCPMPKIKTRRTERRVDPSRGSRSGGLLLLLFFLLRVGGRGFGAFGSGGRGLGAVRGGHGLAVGGGRVVVALALTLLDASGFAGQVAQVVEARLVDAAARDDFDLVDVRRVVGEDPLDADAVRDLADGEGRPGALRDAADAHAFEGLEARLLAFANLCPDLDRVTRAELGQCRLPVLTLFDGFEDPVRAHGSAPRGTRVLPEIGRGRQVDGLADRPNRRSRRIAPALRTERWFQSDAPSIGASTRDTDGIR